MKVIQNIMDFIAKNTLRVVFSIIFVVAIFIKAMYHFDDYPYFETVTIHDAIIGLIIVSIFLIIYIKRNWLQEHVNYKICLLLFVICTVVYIWLVPLTPFSDMRAVYEGAINFANFEWDAFTQDDYWNMFPGNIKLSVFWGVLLIPFPKKLVTIKILNAIFVYVIVALTREIAKSYGVKYYNIVYLLLLTFSPLFLYINHVYFDIPVIMLMLASVYIFKKKNNIILSFFVLALARYVRKNVTIFLLAMIIIFVFENKEKILNKQVLKELGKMLIGILLFFSVYNMLIGVVNDRFVKGNYKSYPSWNQIYIGINEPEFGFMDHDFSYDRSVEDVLNRIKEYGPLKMTKIILKKTFWLWSQGTYQAQRYAFGSDVNDSEEKFEYETFITKRLLNDNQILRKFINSFMRAQYLLLFGLMIFAMWKIRDIDNFRLFYYIIIATFLVMLVYELKSRYILQTLPFMVIFAGQAIELIEDRTIRKKGKQNDKV